MTPFTGNVQRRAAHGNKADQWLPVAGKGASMIAWWVWGSLLGHKQLWDQQGFRGESGGPVVWQHGPCLHLDAHSCASYTDGLAPSDSKGRAHALSDGVMPLSMWPGDCRWQKPRPAVSSHPPTCLELRASHRHVPRLQTGPRFVHLPFPRTVVFQAGCPCEGIVNFFHFILIKGRLPCSQHC